MHPPGWLESSEDWIVSNLPQFKDEHHLKWAAKRLYLQTNSTQNMVMFFAFGSINSISNTWRAGKTSIEGLALEQSCKCSVDGCDESRDCAPQRPKRGELAAIVEGYEPGVENRGLMVFCLSIIVGSVMGLFGLFGYR